MDPGVQLVVLNPFGPLNPQLEFRNKTSKKDAVSVNVYPSAVNRFG